MLPQSAADQIAAAAFIKEEEVETALRELPVTVKEKEGTYKYRLDEASSYPPSGGCGRPTGYREAGAGVVSVCFTGMRAPSV